MIRPARSHGSRSRVAAGRPLCKRKTPPTFENVDGVFRAFTSRKVAALEKKTSRHRLRSCYRKVPGEIILRFHLTSFRDNGEASFCGSASTPERGPAGSVQRIGQGRLVILLALAFKLLLGFPEARDARCDFGAVARESFFLLRHRP